MMIGARPRNRCFGMSLSTGLSSIPSLASAIISIVAFSCSCCCLLVCIDIVVLSSTTKSRAPIDILYSQAKRKHFYDGKLAG